MAVNVKEINIPKFGWRALNSALETMVSVIKATAPNVEGPGVSLTSHGDGGIEISLAQTGTGGSSGDSQQQQQQPQQQQQGTWVTITAFDSNGNPVTLTVLSQDGNLNSTSTPVWTDVGLIDPVTCRQTPKTVLVKQ